MTPEDSCRIARGIEKRKVKLSTEQWLLWKKHYRRWPSRNYCCTR